MSEKQKVKRWKRGPEREREREREEGRQEVQIDAASSFFSSPDLSYHRPQEGKRGTCKIEKTRTA
jgi:hypothetical protein